MTVGWTNDSWINHLWINQKHVLFPYNSIFQCCDFIELERIIPNWNVIRSELWFTLFFLLIQHSTSNKNANWLNCYHNLCYFYMLWIIVELFALFHTFAEVNEPMQLYRQSLCAKQKATNHKCRFSLFAECFFFSQMRINIENATAFWTNFCLVEIALKLR